MTKRTSLVWDIIILADVLVLLALVGATLAQDPTAIKVQGADTSGILVRSQIYPPGATGTAQTQITSSSTGANSAITATLNGVAGKTTYISSVIISGNGATASSGITVTITGTIGGTLNIIYVTGTLNTAGDGLETITFPYPVAASAPNTSIVVSVPAMGAGNTLAAVTATGFQQ